MAKLYGVITYLLGKFWGQRIVLRGYSFFAFNRCTVAYHRIHRSPTASVTKAEPNSDLRFRVGFRVGGFRIKYIPNKNILGCRAALHVPVSAMFDRW